MSGQMIRLTNREDDQKTIELVTKETTPDKAMLDRTNTKVYRVATRRTITLGAACDAGPSEDAQRKGKVEGEVGGAAWHPSKTIDKDEYKAILAGASGSVVKGWLDNNQIAVG
jgi:hypothetical protein